MSDQKTCPACILKAGIHRVGQWPGTLTTVDKTCTGRPGCVRDVGPRGMVGRIVAEHERLTTPDRENPAPDSAPAGAGVPDGKADIVDRLRQGTVMADVRWPGDNSPPVDEYETDALMAEAAAEIARLRAENERLTGERDEAKAHHVQWVTEVDADLTEIEANMDRQDAERAAHIAALATRVAEAVREACKQAVIGTYGDARNHDRMDAIDLAAVLAGVTGEGA